MAEVCLVHAWQKKNTPRDPSHHPSKCGERRKRVENKRNVNESLYLNFQQLSVSKQNEVGPKGARCRCKESERSAADLSTFRSCGLASNSYFTCHSCQAEGRWWWWVPAARSPFSKIHPSVASRAGGEERADWQFALVTGGEPRSFLSILPHTQTWSHSSHRARLYEGWLMPKRAAEKGMFLDGEFRVTVIKMIRKT